MGEIGLSPDEFYDMTHREVFLCIEGYNKKLLREARYNALLQTYLHNNIAIQAKDGKQKRPSDLFPDLFESNKVELSEQDHEMIKDYLKRCN